MASGRLAAPWPPHLAALLDADTEAGARALSARRSPGIRQWGGFPRCLAWQNVMVRDWL